MLDIHSRDGAAHASLKVYNAEFFRIELSPTDDGRIFVALTATTVDDREPQLLDQEIACDCVATLDDVLALIKAHVRVSPPPSHAVPSAN